MFNNISNSFTHQEEESFWMIMSDELTMEIFKRLDYRDLCNVARTCVKWNIIANDDLVTINQSINPLVFFMLIFSVTCYLIVAL